MMTTTAIGIGAEEAMSGVVTSAGVMVIVAANVAVVVPGAECGRPAVKTRRFGADQAAKGFHFAVGRADLAAQPDLAGRVDRVEVIFAVVRTDAAVTRILFEAARDVAVAVTKTRSEVAHLGAAPVATLSAVDPVEAAKAAPGEAGVVGAAAVARRVVRVEADVAEIEIATRAIRTAATGGP